MSSNPTVRSEGAATVVEVGGDLDVQTGPALREVLYELAAKGGQDVVLDLSQVSFLDSSGLGVLVGALKRTRAAGGSLRLAGCSGSVLDVLTLTGLNRVFALEPDVATALAGEGPDTVIVLPAEEPTPA
ncbi:MAG: STAS domain-containing protein [Kineosporiaceae bacterium]